MHSRRHMAIYVPNTNAMFHKDLIGKICTKLYQNRPRFVKDTTKTFRCFFGLQFQLPFTHNRES